VADPDLVLQPVPLGAGVPDAVLQRDVLDLLARHPLGLRRADLRRELSVAYASRLPAPELAVLDTRVGHALARLKAVGDVVHDEKRQRYQRRRDADGSRGQHLPAPPVGRPPDLGDGEQGSLF